MAMLLSGDNVQRMHCVALSNGLYNIDANCYNVCKFYADLKFEALCSYI